MGGLELAPLRCSKADEKDIYEDSQTRESKAMVKITRLSCVLVLTEIAAVIVHSQDTTGDYVAPSEGAPRGKVPRMQLRLLTKQDSIFHTGSAVYARKIPC
jgi:hypothetical protein